MTALARSLRSSGELRSPDGNAGVAGGKRRLRLVEQRRKRRVGRAVGIGVAITIAVTTFAIALTHVTMTQTAFDLEAEQNLLAELREQNEQLELAVAILEAPDRIRNDATSRLEMVPPSAIYYLKSEEVSSGDDGPGTPPQPGDTPAAPRRTASAPRRTASAETAVANEP